MSASATLRAAAWQYEFATQRYTQIAPVRTPGVNLSTMMTPKLYIYKAQDGLELTGWLYLPKGFKQPGPVVLSFHGGPEGQERPTFKADYQAILAQGIAVFAPNIRGSSGFGKKFLALDDREKRFDANRDVYDSAQMLIKSGIGSRARLGIMASILPPIFLLVAVFLLNVSLSRLVATERSNIGLLKAFGYGDVSIALHYGKFAIVFALLGAAIGVIVGQYLGGYMFPYFGNKFASGSIEFRVVDVTSTSATLAMFEPLINSTRVSPAIATSLRTQVALGSNGCPIEVAANIASPSISSGNGSAGCS